MYNLQGGCIAILYEFSFAKISKIFHCCFVEIFSLNLKRGGVILLLHCKTGHLFIESIYLLFCILILDKKSRLNHVKLNYHQP